MVQDSLVYDPKRDLNPVDQDGFIDLVEAFQNKVIPSDVVGKELDFQDCEDTDALLPKAEDVFDQIQQLHTIRGIKDAKEKESEVSS